MESFRTIICSIMENEARYLEGQDDRDGLSRKVIQYVHDWMMKAYVAGHLAGAMGAIKDLQGTYDVEEPMDKFLAERKFLEWIKDV